MVRPQDGVRSAEATREDEATREARGTDEVNERTFQSAVVSQQRVYEYINPDNGVVYYSFTKHDKTISPPVRLVLQSRVGTHFISFLSRLRKLVEEG